MAVEKSLLKVRDLLCAGAAIAGLVAGPAGATTLQQALLQAYSSSPVLTTARAQLRATDEDVPIAKAQSRLQVSGTAAITQETSDITRFDNGGRVFTGGVNLTYPLFQGGRVKNGIHAAEARDIGGRADLRTTEGNFFVQAVSAYMDVIRDEAIVQLNIKNVRVLETNLKASHDRFQVGDLTRTDVAQSEARLSLARSQLSTVQGNLVHSREVYREVIGVWPEALEAPPPLPSLPPSPDQAASIALGNNPAIASAAAQAKAAGYDVRTAAGARLPTFSAVAGSTYYNYLSTPSLPVGLPQGVGGIGGQGYGQAYSSNSVGVQMTVPLYQGGLPAAKVRQARALESAAIERGIDVERQVIANTRAAFAEYQAAEAAIAANQQAVSANSLALEGVRAENTAGTRTVLDVLNAEQEYLNAQVSLVTAEHDRYVAGFALLNAMGKAEARDLNLDGGALYDPLAYYNRVHKRLGDWSDGSRPTAQASRTTGPTPADSDVLPLQPAPDTGVDQMGPPAPLRTGAPVTPGAR